MAKDEEGANPATFPEIIDEFGSLFRWSVGVGVFGLLGALLASLSLGVYAFAMGNLDRASSYTTFTSGLATVLLVGLTGWYAVQTRRMVTETRQSREQEQEEYERRRRREITSLRRALYEEIRAIRGLDEFADEYEPSKSVAGFQVPTAVYRANAQKLGLLSEEEADLVVEYYSRVEFVQERMRLQRELDTTVDMDAVTEIHERMQALLRSLIRTVTFGYYGERGAKKRAEQVRKLIRELDHVQEEATTALERNLDDSS